MHTKKIIAFLFIGIITLNYNFISCQKKQSQMEWKYIDFDQIPEEKNSNHEYYSLFNQLTKYRFNYILNYNKDIFFLLGNDDQRKLNDSTNSVIYATYDFGDTWHKTTLGKGTVEFGCFSGEKMFVLVQEVEFPRSEWKSAIYSSEDLGKTWKEELKSEQGNQIMTMMFYSDKVRLLAILHYTPYNDSWVYEYQYTEDGGKNWKKINFNSDFNPEGYQRGYCIFNSDSTILYVDKNTQLIEFNLKTEQKKTLKTWNIPEDMKFSNIIRDPKTNEIILKYASKKVTEDKSALYYVEREEYVVLPDNYFLATYGDLYYGLVFDQPLSTYVWSTDRGKTWNKEKLDYVMIYSNWPKSYYGEGYMYMQASLFRREDEHLGRGNRFCIAHPILNQKTTK
ncbi:hypothetical protein ETU08_09735 [Apibacter muscae]|uniref:WD40/YVTN/BNR-like repeat-containing protein n=1 Tax=Apibacter muscae TaxID=2509004 RepID=UPI0011AC0B4B|nr:hypothetical protein [Apibacter muscae]TWP27988.1 hypothetical protein ETU08_09735 [Apibacter muscae]